MRYAHVINNEVVNVSLWDGVTDYTPPAGQTLHKLEPDSPVGPGWAFRDGKWVDERPPVDLEDDN